MSAGDEGRPVIGLCASCVHHRSVVSDRGSHFHLCERSRTDPAYPRYPMLPVLRCAGHEPVEPAGGGQGSRGRAERP